jgi:hypothetical protein
METDELEVEDETDDLFGWVVETFNSGGTNLNDYTCTLNGEKVTSVSDGNQTVPLT